LLSSFLFNDSINKYEFHIDYYTKITNPIPLLSFLLLFKFDLVCKGCEGGDWIFEEFSWASSMLCLFKTTLSTVARTKQ
jgi:hypothetical protein